jgi:hypothetical protein
MTAISHGAEPAHRPAHLVKTAVLVVLFWSAAASLVVLLNRFLQGSSPVLCVAAQTLAILAAAFLYMRFAASVCSVDHALFVGAAWLVLAIAAEISMTARTGHGWYEIIGSPASALRNILMFAWILAPSLFSIRAA